MSDFCVHVVRSVLLADLLGSLRLEQCRACIFLSNLTLYSYSLLKKSRALPHQFVFNYRVGPSLKARQPSILLYVIIMKVNAT